MKVIEQWRVVDRWWTAEPIEREFREVEDNGERWVEVKEQADADWRRVERDLS